MSDTQKNRYPALHNAMWPGLVGKGPDSEPPIDLDTMLDLTAAAEVDGVRFDGVDLFFLSPIPTSILPTTTWRGLRRKLLRRVCGWVAGGAGVAADRWRFRHGR